MYKLFYMYKNSLQESVLKAWPAWLAAEGEERCLSTCRPFLLLQPSSCRQHPGSCISRSCFSCCCIFIFVWFFKKRKKFNISNVQLGILKIKAKLSKQENKARGGPALGTPRRPPPFQEWTPPSPHSASLESLCLGSSVCCLHEFLAAKFVR